MLEKIGQWLQGKKTYIIAVLIALGAGAISLGYVVPEWVWLILGAAGLGGIRSALDKVEKPSG